MITRTCATERCYNAYTDKFIRTQIEVIPFDAPIVYQIREFCSEKCMHSFGKYTYTKFVKEPIENRPEYADIEWAGYYCVGCYTDGFELD